MLYIFIKTNIFHFYIVIEMFLGVPYCECVAEYDYSDYQDIITYNNPGITTKNNPGITTQNNPDVISYSYEDPVVISYSYDEQQQQQPDNSEKLEPPIQENTLIINLNFYINLRQCSLSCDQF